MQAVGFQHIFLYKSTTVPVIPARFAILHRDRGAADGWSPPTVPAKESPPDVAFLDVEMPGEINGLDLGKKLKELYLSLTEEEKEILTDACKIFAMKGEPVYLVDGEVSNMKITYADDLPLAEAILANFSEK